MVARKNSTRSFFDKMKFQFHPAQLAISGWSDLRRLWDRQVNDLTVAKDCPSKFVTPPNYSESRLISFRKSRRREKKLQPLFKGPITGIWDYPPHLTHVEQVFSDGTVNLKVVVYFPVSYSPPAEYLERPQLQLEPSVQVKVGNGQWQSLNHSESEPGYWFLTLERVPQGSRLTFRCCFFKDNIECRQPIAPLMSDIECMYGVGYVPNLIYDWKNQPPKFSHAQVLMETTLEGMLAGYQNGNFAPRNIEELLQRSLAQRILDTDIPERLADLAVDEVMFPVGSSVADRSHLNPKFNYLLYNVADVDWQIGQTRDFKQLLDRFYGNGIEIVPDLVFCHEVKSPFEGSADQISRLGDGNNKLIYVDSEPFLFRDYGTWMFNLAELEIRRMLVEKIVSFVEKYRLKMIRLDYLDGLLLQYSNRQENFGEQLIQELEAELRRKVPDLLILGEAFETAGNPAVNDLIDIVYSPRGFSIVEELYKPPSQSKRPLYPDLSPLIESVKQAAQSGRDEAVYAQLHDESWFDEHVSRGRPRVPWAYGANPAQLAKNKGEELILMQLLQPENLLEFVRRTVRNAEALTIFLTNRLYMFVPAVDSLSLGSLDEPERWKVVWEDIFPQDMAEWKKNGIPEWKIFQQHEQHRADMVKLREIFRQYTEVNEDTYIPLVQPEVYHFNPAVSLLGLYRRNLHELEKSLIVVFNFGPQAFRDFLSYELPVPLGLVGKWKVLFDGDWIDPQRRLSKEKQSGYQPGTVLKTTFGSYSALNDVLRLEIGARSLLLLSHVSG